VINFIQIEGGFVNLAMVARIENGTASRGDLLYGADGELLGESKESLWKQVIGLIPCDGCWEKLRWFAAGKTTAEAHVTIEPIIAFGFTAGQQLAPVTVAQSRFWFWDWCPYAIRKVGSETVYMGDVQYATLKAWAAAMAKRDKRELAKKAASKAKA
jgi:hypothetical protein